MDFYDTFFYFMKDDIFLTLLNIHVIVYVKFLHLINTFSYNNKTLYGCYHSNDISVNKLQRKQKLHQECHLDVFTQTV